MVVVKANRMVVQLVVWLGNLLAEPMEDSKAVLLGVNWVAPWVGWLVLMFLDNLDESLAWWLVVLMVILMADQLVKVTVEKLENLTVDRRVGMKDLKPG